MDCYYWTVVCNALPCPSKVCAVVGKGRPECGMSICPLSRARKGNDGQQDEGYTERAKLDQTFFERMTGWH